MPSDSPALQGFSPPTAFVQNVPSGTFLNSNTYYYFVEVSNQDWKDGEWQRIRMKMSRARRIAKQTGYGVKFSPDQSKD